MARIFGTLVILAVLSGCTSVSSYNLVGGGTGYEVYCSPLLPNQCSERAAEQCPSGFVVLANPQIDSQSAYKMVRNLDVGGDRLDFTCKP